MESGVAIREAPEQPLVWGLGSSASVALWITNISAKRSILRQFISMQHGKDNILMFGGGAVELMLDFFVDRMICANTLQNTYLNKKKKKSVLLFIKFEIYGKSCKK